MRNGERSHRSRGAGIQDGARRAVYRLSDFRVAGAWFRRPWPCPSDPYHRSRKSTIYSVPVGDGGHPGSQYLDIHYPPDGAWV